MRIQIDGRRLRRHWQYSWWKYLLLIVFAVFGWNLLFTMTTPAIPADKELMVYVSSNLLDDQLMDGWLAGKKETDFPDQEKVACLKMLSDAYYGRIQLTAYMTSDQGDVYLMQASDFLSYAETGVFLPL